MTHTGRNMSGSRPASNDAGRVASLLVLALSLLAAASAGQAADQPTGPFLFTSSPKQGQKDIETEARVRRALRNDRQLTPLNLGVHLSGGIARLYGPVPSQELRQRAITIVERVEGVLKVNARDLYLSSSTQAAPRMTVQIQDEQPTQTRAASPHTLSHGTVPFPSRSEPAPPPVAAVEPRTVRPVDPAITLQAPEMAPRPARVPEPARLTANPRPAPRAVPLATAVERLRQGDARFQGIRTRVEGATVSIFPGDATVDDAMLLAQAIRRLPGVQHVILASGSR